MDISKKYIKMCKKAKEIQKLWKPITGDLYVDNRQTKKEAEITPSGIFLRHVIDGQEEWFIWLPRQDQLQEMIDDPIEFAIDKFYSLQEYGNAFHDYIDNQTDSKYWKSMQSMEQLWLAFVMKEKYNKVWDGKDWEKE